MSSFNPTKYGYALLKITRENYEKYCTDIHIPVDSYLGFDLSEGIYLYADTAESYDYICSSDEEFDRLVFLHYLEK